MFHLKWLALNQRAVSAPFPSSVWCLKSEKLWKNWFCLFSALSGGVSFQNFRIRSITVGLTFHGSKHTKSLRLDRSNLTLKGSALKFFQETPPGGQKVIFYRVSLFSHLLTYDILFGLCLDFSLSIHHNVLNSKERVAYDRNVCFLSDQIFLGRG